MPSASRVSGEPHMKQLVTGGAPPASSVGAEKACA